MQRTWIEYQTPELAGWLWLAVIALAVSELVRYVLRGVRPAAREARLAIAATSAIGVVVLAAVGGWRPDGRTFPLACAALAVLVVIGLRRTYRQTTRDLSRRTRAWLTALRAAEALVLIGLILQPSLQTSRVTRERAVLGILLDDSASMTVRDVPAGSGAVARIEAVTAALEQNRALLERLGDHLDIRWLRFGERLEEVPRPQLSGEASATSLLGSIERAGAMLGATGRKLAGLVVISDGRDTMATGMEASAVGATLDAAAVPVLAFPVGSETPVGKTRSLVARRLECPLRVGLLNRLDVRAEFSSVGLSGETVRVELAFDEIGVAETQLRPKSANELLAAELAHVPTRGGLHRVTVTARAGEGPAELVASLSQYVQVTDDIVQVLYIDRPRYERAAVSRALEGAKELKVTRYEVNVPAGAGGVRVDCSPYDVVLLGDIDRRMLAGDTLQRLGRHVLEGGNGLAMLAGYRTLGSGAYAGSALMNVLPVNLAAAGQEEGAVGVRLTAAGANHPILQVAGDAAGNQRAWGAIPPFAGVSILAGVGPAAEVLMESTAGQPLLVVQEAGKGRSAAVAFDSTWQWSFASEAGGEIQRRFWRQLVLWLANRQAQVWVSTDRPRYDLRALEGGEEILIRVGVAGAAGEPTSAVELEGTIGISGTEATPLRWVRTPDGFEARTRVSAAGSYRVQVRARAGERAIGEAETAFVVEAPNLELAEPLADHETLRRLAAPTADLGGGVFALSELPRVLEGIRAAGHVTEYAQVRRTDLVREYRRGWLAAFLVLVTVEWVVRRRKGLV